MKQLFNILLLASAVLFTGSCSKDDDANDVSSTTATTLKSGTWKISSYINDGNDETSDFNSFIFTFGNSNVVTATNSLLSASGTWSTGTDNSTAKLNLSFTSPPLFTELTEDWEILQVTSTTVSLHHQSGGGGGMDMLTFQKN